MSTIADKPRHILYLIDELKVKGGTEKHLFELATGMADAGFRITVFTLSEGAYAQEFKDDPRIAFTCLHVTRIYDKRGLSAIFEIARYISKEQVDIVQSFHTAADLIGPLAARLSFCRPKVFSSRRDLGYTKSQRHRKAQSYINAFVDGILANSQAVKQSVCEQEGYPADKITVIYNGIDIEPFAADEGRRQLQREKLGVNADTIVIGSVGNIRPVKGYDLLVEAAGKVCSQTPNVHFCHAGEGDMLEKLVKRCRALGIENKFTFLGSVKDIPSFLNGLDIYVQPSRSEGLSNAILEAMSARLPVIATDVGGNPDLIDNGVNGLLVELHESAIAEHLLDLVRQTEQREGLGSRAFEKVLERFKMSSMLKKYDQLYTFLKY